MKVIIIKASGRRQELYGKNYYTVGLHSSYHHCIVFMYFFYRVVVTIFATCPENLLLFEPDCTIIILIQSVWQHRVNTLISRHLKCLLSWSFCFFYAVYSLIPSKILTWLISTVYCIFNWGLMIIQYWDSLVLWRVRIFSVMSWGDYV